LKGYGVVVNGHFRGAVAPDDAVSERADAHPPQTITEVMISALRKHFTKMAIWPRSRGDWNWTKVSCRAARRYAALRS
jgi:hypothetical protein